MPWGLYISQFTFLVGIGASAVTVLLPYYVHRQKVFARALILGEIVAVIALVQALLCITVDLGKPGRLLNILLYPAPSSLMFWDCLTLGGYLTLSVVGLAATLFARGASPAKWVRGLALATIPWAIGIHVVTALLYAGLAARPAWMTAVLAPRFLGHGLCLGTGTPHSAGGPPSARQDLRYRTRGHRPVVRHHDLRRDGQRAPGLARGVHGALLRHCPPRANTSSTSSSASTATLGWWPGPTASWLLLLLALVVLLIPRLRRRWGWPMRHRSGARLRAHRQGTVPCHFWLRALASRLRPRLPAQPRRVGHRRRDLFRRRPGIRCRRLPLLLPSDSESSMH
jgi:hypothetical protein